jgi:NADPH:quinone reductase-like Zn-dependent oxidoreductase
MRHSLPLAALAMWLALSAEAAPDKMQAVEVGAGGRLSVQTRPVPRPKAGEVLIKVHAASVNPVDWKIAQRRLGMVAGIDVAGTIDMLGEGVSGWKVGDAVLGSARESGGYAEYATIPVASLARKPKSLSFEEASGIPIAAETAYRALHETAKLQPGQTVLIHGAAGGVGSAAVQIAKAKGARVIGTASASNHDFLKSLGVDEVIDYRSQKFEELVKNVDVVLNTANSETNARSIGVVRPGGHLVSIVGPPDAAACGAAQIICGMPDRGKGASNADLLAQVVELADVGKFKVFVEQTYSMADANQAWQNSRDGHTRGKLVIRVSEGPTMKHQ